MAWSSPRAVRIGRSMNGWNGRDGSQLRNWQSLSQRPHILFLRIHNRLACSGPLKFSAMNIGLTLRSPDSEVPVNWAILGCGACLLRGQHAGPTNQERDIDM
eukprot:2461196-Pyramimonas_sp.AAC.1